MKKLVRATVVATSLLAMLLYSGVNYIPPETREVSNTTPVAGVCAVMVTDNDILSVELPDNVAVSEPETSDDTDISEEIWYDDLELLALTTLAEAEGEPELGKRLVIDTILNRVNDTRFPNTIHEVIYSPGQFTIFDNGRINRVQMNDEIAALVLEELNVRTNTEVLYFNSIGFNDWSQPIEQVGNHYFSK